MKIGIAADHGGFQLKTQMIEHLEQQGYFVHDYGAYDLNPIDDYPDFVIPLCQALVQGQIERGILICGSGVGANVTANKIPGIRAALIHDIFSAHQGVEDDNMNVICLGGRVVSTELAWDYIDRFLSARYQSAERFQRRLSKISQLEHKECASWQSKH